MRIWLQKHAISGRVPELDACYGRLVDLAAGLGAQLDIHTLPAEIYEAALPEGFVRYGAVEELFATYFARQAMEAEQRGYDVFVIATSQDPGLRTARRLTAIPCVGYGETSLRLAQLYTDRIGVVGFIPELQTPIEENYRSYGLGGAKITFQYLGTPPEAITRAFTGDQQDFLDAFHDAARRCIDAGCEVIIPGEGLPNELLARAGVTDVDGASVIDSDAAVVRQAVMVGQLVESSGLTRPRRGYWNARPPAGLLEQLRGVLES